VASKYGGPKERNASMNDRQRPGALSRHRGGGGGGGSCRKKKPRRVCVLFSGVGETSATRGPRTPTTEELEWKDSEDELDVEGKSLRCGEKKKHGDSHLLTRGGLVKHEEGVKLS